MTPLDRLATRALAEYDSDMKTHGIAILEGKLRAEEAEKQARKELSKNLSANIMHLLDAGEPATVPTLKRYQTNSATVEALGDVLRENPNGLLVVRDELVSLLKPMERDDRAEERGFYLTGWNGDSSFTFDRIMRGKNLHINAVCLSLIGGTQPGKLASFVRSAMQGGDGDDGLLQRFSLAVWPDNAGAWRNVDRWPDHEAKRIAYQAFDFLDQLDPSAIQAEQDSDIDGNAVGIPYLRFDDRGLELFESWRTDLEAELRSNVLHPALESHFAKYRKLVPSLALLWHLLSNGIGAVNFQAVLTAIAWEKYLRSHAMRIYESGRTATRDAAMMIVRKIQRGDLGCDGLSARQIYRKGWSGLTDGELVQDALDMLVEHDWMRCETHTTGGRDAIMYRFNPLC